VTLTSLKTVHHELHKALKHHITLITLSEHGIYFSDGKNSGIIEAHKRDISDVSGAGDTVIAVATLALISGMNLKDAADLANLAGGLVCEHSGVVPVTKEMLLQSS
ncbi:MAG: PfkB family carbohydrate kinase, partial [Chitinophagales bacterium]